MNEEKNSVGFRDVCKSTLMSFFGVQKDSIRRRDFEKGRPSHFIAAGILLTLVFIGILIGFVRVVLHFAGL